MTPVQMAVRLLSVFAAICLISASTAAAQPVQEKSVPEGTKESAGLQIEEVKPEVLYLRDKDRNLVALPGFTLEQFMDLYRLKNGLDAEQQRPRYSLQRLNADGTAEGEFARLTISADIVLHRGGWSLVPLQLGNTVLQDGVTYKGDGKQFFQYDAEAGGYACWIQGEEDSQHQLSFDVLVPLTTVSGQKRLAMAAPQATTSHLSLTVPIAPVVASSEGTSPPTVTDADSGKTRIQVLGLKGTFSLAWRKADARVAETPVLLEASSTIYSKLDGRSTNSEAQLTVRSLGAPFDQLRVKLPPGAQWIGGQQPGYAVTAEPGSGFVNIKLDKKEVGPVKIKLVTEQPYDLTRADQWIELAGFEVDGAVRQWGHIAVSVVGDWRLVWGKRSRVRQVDELPESLQSKETLAGFEFLGQPSSLKVRVVERIPRVSVDPEYQYLIDADQVQLKASWNYRVRGGKIYSLSIDVGDWDVEEVGPASLVDSNAWTQENGVLTVPLVQPSAGTFSLAFNARRSADPASGKLELNLPAPQSDVLGQATLIVAPADNVEVIPRADQLVGLSRQSGFGRPKLPDRRQDPLVYWAEPEGAKFVGDFRLLRQRVQIEVENDVRVQPEKISVEQRFRYQIAHEPLQELLISMPRQLAVAGNPEFQVDGQTIEPTILEASAAPDAEEMLLSISPSTAKIGSSTLSIRYSVMQGELLPDATTSVSIPLLTPGQGDAQSSRSVVRSAPGLAVDVLEGPWEKVETAPVAGAEPELVLSATDPAGEISLALHLDQRQATGSTVIDRAWIQTWLSDTSRRDRAAYRFITSESELRIRLPSNVEGERLDVLLNGARISPTFDDSGILVIQLGQQVAMQPNSLEIRYYFPNRPAEDSALQLEFPTFMTPVWVRQNYWHLVLPSDEHLVTSPWDQTREFTWNWRGFYWARKPVMEQADLEGWVGASREAVDPRSANQYLFSSIQPNQVVRVWTVPRSLVVFGASLIVLTAGLIFLYAPATRHPAVLLLATVVLLGLSLAYPDQAILIGQASVLGLLLALFAAVLQQAVNRRRRRGVVIRSGPSSIVERSGTQPYHRTARESRSSTRTAALALEMPAAENP